MTGEQVAQVIAILEAAETLVDDVLRPHDLYEHPELRVAVERVTHNLELLTWQMDGTPRFHSGA